MSMSLRPFLNGGSTLVFLALMAGCGGGGGNGRDIVGEPDTVTGDHSAADVDDVAPPDVVDTGTDTTADDGTGTADDLAADDDAGMGDSWGSAFATIQAHVSHEEAIGDVSDATAAAKLSDAAITGLNTEGRWRYNCSTGINAFVRNDENSWSSNAYNDRTWGSASMIPGSRRRFVDDVFYSQVPRDSTRWIPLTIPAAIPVMDRRSVG